MYKDNPSRTPSIAQHSSSRTCALTGQEAPAAELLCFVAAPDGRVVFDIKQNLPVTERLWLVPQRCMVERACTEGVFASLGEGVVYSDALAAQVERQLMQQAQDSLHLLRRSGALVFGFEKVRIGIARPDAALLVQAYDAAVDGRAKLAKLAGHHHIPVIDHLFSRAMLAQVTGQENQVHVLLRHSGLTQGFIGQCHRLDSYNGKKTCL